VLKEMNEPRKIKKLFAAVINKGLCDLYESLRVETDWSCMITFTPRPLYFQGKRRQYYLDRGLDGLQIRSGCYREE
jgi:hypothetical protein